MEEWRLCMRVTALPRSAPPSFPHPPLGAEAFCHQNPPSEFNFSGFGTFSPNNISDWLETLLGNDYRALLWTGDGTADRCVLLLLLRCQNSFRPLSFVCPSCSPTFCHAAYAALLVLNLTLFKLLNGLYVLNFGVALFLR